MKRSLVWIIMAMAGLFSCKQNSKSTPKTVDTETINSVRRYVYADAAGKRFIIHNSEPKGGMQYTDPNGKTYGYVVFWTQITNETLHPVELNIDFPLDTFEFPSSSGRYMKLLLPSDTMTMEKKPLFDYGLNVKSFLDNDRDQSSSLKRTIQPKGSTAFYVVMLSAWNPTAGGSGALRTGFSLQGKNLFYKISAYKMAAGFALIDKKGINCGSVNIRDLVLQQ